jgi:hypothetical protein
MTMSDKKAHAEIIDSIFDELIAEGQIGARMFEETKRRMRSQEVVYDDRQREKLQHKFMKPSAEAQASGAEAQARINGDKELNHKILSLEELVAAMTIHIDEMRNRLERLEDNAANHESNI